MEKVLKIGDAVYLNDLINNAKFDKTLKDSSIGILLEFKFQLSKIVKEKDEFIKDSVESLKSERFKELQSKENKSKEETDEYEAIIKNLDKTINTIVSKYLTRETTITIENLDKSELFLFCKTNDFNVQVTEILYNLIVL